MTRRFNPDAQRLYTANTFQYPAWLSELRHAGLINIEVFGFTTSLRYSQNAWVGRVKASSAIGPSLAAEQVQAFEAAFAETLEERFGDAPLDVEHIAFAVVARKA
ncbi:MAG: hypothetical protein ACRC56_11130 [Bosea sp. (in: a-proteobacteria)]